MYALPIESTKLDSSFFVLCVVVFAIVRTRFVLKKIVRKHVIFY